MKIRDAHFGGKKLQMAKDECKYTCKLYQYEYINRFF